MPLCAHMTACSVAGDGGSHDEGRNGDSNNDGMKVETVSTAVAAGDAENSSEAKQSTVETTATKADPLFFGTDDDVTPLKLSWTATGASYYGALCGAAAALLSADNCAICIS